MPTPCAPTELDKGWRPISLLASPGKLHELFWLELVQQTVAQIDRCLLGLVPGKQPMEIVGSYPWLSSRLC